MSLHPQCGSRRCRRGSRNRWSRREIPMLQLLIALVLILAPADSGAQFTVTAGHTGTVYIEISAEGGARLQSPTMYQVDLKAGESFGKTIEAAGPGRIRVRVWDGATDPS